jgi:hypothetical protein
VDLMSVGKFARSRLTGKRNIMYEVKAQPPPRVDGVAGAASLIYHGEVNQDSDGPVEYPVTAAQSQLALPLRDRVGAA